MAFPKGVPAPDDPRRCSSMCKNRNVRCTQWGINGTSPPLCRKHGGRNRQNAQKKRLNASTRHQLPMLYRKRLGPTLQRAVAEATGVDPDEQVAIYSELALLREYAGQFVAMYSAAVEAQEAAIAAGDAAKIAKIQSHVTSAGSMMAEALTQVTDTCSKAAKIADKQKDRFSIHDLRWVIDKILIIHHRVVGKEHPELARAFAKSLEQDLELPHSSDRGTELHPDQTARQYDDSVPYVEDFEDE